MKHINIKQAFIPGISFNFLFHTINQIYRNKSPLRLIHNFFLKNISIKGKTIDLGAGNHRSYYNFLNKNTAKIFLSDLNNNNFLKLNLEKKLPIKSGSYDSVILFNVLEHIENYDLLIKEIKRILKPKGIFQIFVPFYFRYHEDFKDIFRPTHFFLENILKKKGFSVETKLICVGPLINFCEMFSKYIKIRVLIFIFFWICIFLDRIIKFFSKDFIVFYGGTHCSCQKI